jgi:hypothetical protein
MADELIPDGEELYIRLRPQDVNGDIVTRGGVRMPQSCNRSRDSKPDDVIVAKRPEYNGIGVITPRELPGSFLYPETNKRYHFIAVYDWKTENPAHSEIRSKVEGEAYKKNANPKAMEIAKEKLAARIRIMRKPTAI